MYLPGMSIAAAPRPVPPLTASRAAALLLGGVGAFQVALAASAPWGAAAWGGAATGVLPPELRVASAGSAAAYAVLAIVVGSARGSARTRRALLTGASALMGAGTVMNLASPSLVERLLWTPVAAGLAVLLWRARREAPAR